MTEELRVTPEKQEQLAYSEQDKDSRRTILQRTFLISALFLLFAFINDLFAFFEFNAWQILGDASGLLVALVILTISYLQFRRNQAEKASFLIPFVILFAYAPGDLFLDGVTIYNLISGILLHGITYFIFRPSNWFHWLRQTIIYSVIVLVFGGLNLFDAFDIANSPSWQSSLPITTVSFSLLLVWQFLLNVRITTIRTRLLVILIVLGIGPLLISSLVSVFIDLRRDTTLAETNIQAIADLTQVQIQSWTQSHLTDMRSLEYTPNFISDVEYLTIFTGSEEFETQISEEILGFFENLLLTSPQYRSISLVNSDGEILLSSNPSLEDRSIGQQDEFSLGLVNTHFSTPKFDTLSDEPFLNLYYPLQNESGDLLGLILTEVRTDFLAEIATEAAQLVGTGGEVYVVSAENKLITPMQSVPEMEIGFNAINSSDFAAQNEEIQAFESEASQYDNIVGDAVIGSFTWIPEIRSLLVVEQDRFEALQSLRLNMVINLTISGIALILTIVIALNTAGRFTQPIQALSKAASDVWRGEVNQIVPIDREDEIGDLSRVLSAMTTRLVETTTNLEQTVAERTAVLERRAKYLETNAIISRAVTDIYDRDSLLNTITQLISENFGFYHVGIFLNDERNEYAVLRATNSEGGWKMLAREHKLKVGSQGIVGHVTGFGEPRIQQQVVGEDSVYFDNPDLPNTRSEMALPLMVGEEVFGALDVQSTEEQAFSEEDVRVLQGLADSVAVAIQNTRLISQLQESLEAERRLFGEVTRESWQAMLSRKNQAFSIRSDKSGTQVITSPDSEIGKRAFEQKRTIIGDLNPETKDYSLAIPVTVRGGVSIGVVETQKPAKDGPWTKEEISILENVCSELGLALDNARLFEETQRRAQRDRIAAELSTKIWSSSDIENILQTAVRELGSALQVSQGTIRLSLPEDDPFENFVDGANQS